MPEGQPKKQEDKPEDTEPIIGSPETGKWVKVKDDKGDVYIFAENTRDYKPLDLGNEIDSATSLDKIVMILEYHGFLDVKKIVNEFIGTLSLAEMTGGF
ncbi:MAG: hypothetical protein EXS48_03355 [Candidatus Staskawiczbacteria bacterium]|nr:hypothetical protein [Candidatus Staskawiczbacteria bacterium]